MAGAGAGWWETSDALGEGASAAPAPLAEGGACEMGEDMAEELSVSEVSKRLAMRSFTMRRGCVGAMIGMREALIISTAVEMFAGHVRGQAVKVADIRTFVVTAVLPGKAVGASGGWVLPVLVVLLAHLLELVLALGSSLCVLVLVTWTRDAVLAHALQLPKRAFGLGAARLDVLQHRLLHVVAHAQQLGAGGDLGAAAAGFEDLFDGDIALVEVGIERLAEVGRGGCRLDRGADVGEGRGVAAARGGGGLCAWLCLALAADGGRHDGRAGALSSGVEYAGKLLRAQAGVGKLLAEARRGSGFSAGGRE